MAEYINNSDIIDVYILHVLFVLLLFIVCPMQCYA